MTFIPLPLMCFDFQFDKGGVTYNNAQKKIILPETSLVGHEVCGDNTHMGILVPKKKRTEFIRSICILSKWQPNATNNK